MVEAGRSLVGVSVNTEHVALRGPDGMPREAGAVAEDFDGAIRSARGRPIVIFTYGTKTGLVAPVEVPAGVDVIVDACQLRLPAHKIREYLRLGWPVVITGSKFLGGPAFSGAVLRAVVPIFAGASAVGARGLRAARRLGRYLFRGYHWAPAPLVGALCRYSKSRRYRRLMSQRASSASSATLSPRSRRFRARVSSSGRLGALAS